MTAPGTGGWERVKEKEKEEAPESEEESEVVRGCSHSLQRAAKLAQTYGFYWEDPRLTPVSETLAPPL